MANTNVTLSQIRNGTGIYQKESGVSLGVMAIQKALHMYGYNLNGTADGIFGSNTEAIVKGFQIANEIEPADGIVNAKTLAKLEAWSGTLYETPTATPALKAVEYGLDILHTGDSGAAVYSVQSLLTRHGYTCQTTGSYTSTVASLVKQFQKKNDLSETGEVDQVTLAMLEDLTSDTAWLNGSTVSLTPGKLAKARFFGILIKPEVVADINKGLNKYGITTGEKVLHFLAQMMGETSGSENIMENHYMPGKGYVPLPEKPVAEYSPYCGAGTLHLTWASEYEKFKDHINYAPNGYPKDENIYPGEDDGKYATQYVALKYPGVSGGWVWEKVKGLNTEISWNNAEANSRAISDKLTEIITGNTDLVELAVHQKRRFGYYELIKAYLPYKK